MFNYLIEALDQLLNRMFKKVELIFDGNVILVIKSDKWDEFSLLKRLPFKFPNTTNS